MKISRQFLRFCIIGGLAFLVDVGVLYWLRTRGFDLYTARVFSFLSAATFSWLGNRLYTFQSKGSKLRQLPGEWLKYLIAMLVGGVVNYGVYAFGVAQFELIVSQPWLGVAAGTAAGLLVNFVLARKILYVKPPASNSEPS